MDFRLHKRNREIWKTSLKVVSEGISPKDEEVKNGVRFRDC